MGPQGAPSRRGGGRGWRLLAPRPLDALKLGEALYPLRPLELPQGAGTNLPEGLSPVGLPSPALKEKPAPLPAFWYWESFLEWLLQDAPAGFAPRGHEGPVPETRTHVALDPAAQTAREGFLFQTSGLEFVRGGAASPWCSGPRGRSPRGSSPWGGEAPRLLAERRARGSSPARGGGGGAPPPQGGPPRLPHPRLLGEAYLPKGRAFQGASVVAAVVGRPLAVSGWNLKEGKPKPSRRAVPAGSVYFVRLPEAWGEGEVRDWAEKVWFQNLSEEEQDRRDGFGLAALGLWDGKLRRWEEA